MFRGPLIPGTSEFHQVRQRKGFVEVTSSEYIGKAAKGALPFEAVVLVLQGGGALGAYQAGVFQAIHESGIQLRWLCATRPSVGFLACRSWAA
jgi:hypothetical protein